MPGAPILLAPSSNPGRSTAFTLTLVRKGKVWVSVVPVLANDIVHGALARDGMPGLEGARVLRREVGHGRSRFDFLLQHGGREVWTEVKSVTLVKGRRALFPDAPTERGTRHVRELLEMRRHGAAAQVVFVVQRRDADRLAPHWRRDPEFAAALTEARRAGLAVRAYTCCITPQGASVEREIPVEDQ